MLNNKPPTSTCHVTHETGLSWVWHKLHKKQFYPFHMELIKGLQPGDNKSLPSVLSVASTQNCRWTWLLVPCIVDWWGNIKKEWGEQYPQSTWMDGGQSSCYLMLFISPKIQHKCLHQNRRLATNWTTCDSKLSQWNPVCWDPWKKNSAVNWRCTS
jgi:hypothetical protein